MGSQQLYSLSWGEFGTSLTSTVQVLRGHGEMVDVTLAAGGKIFPAHKLVLSAASPLLMELLKSTQCHHPVVMLAGITASDLEALLQFVYQGEVSVDPNQLPSLLQAAYCLDIQALSPQTLSTEKSMAPTSVPNMMNDMSPVAIPPMPNSPMLPVRKRKRKQRNSESESVKWTMTEAVGVGVGVGSVVEDVVVEPPGMNQVTGPVGENSMVVEDPLKDENIDDPQHCNGEQLTPPLEGKSRCASEQPRLCPLCGLLIRQARNLRRHLLSACASRHATQLTPDQADYLECQVSTPEQDQYPEHLSQPPPPNTYITNPLSSPLATPDLHHLSRTKQDV